MALRLKRGSPSQEIIERLVSSMRDLVLKTELGSFSAEQLLASPDAAFAAKETTLKRSIPLPMTRKLWNHAVPIVVALSQQTTPTVPPDLPYNRGLSSGYPNHNSLQSEKQVHVNIC